MTERQRQTHREWILTSRESAQGHLRIRETDRQTDRQTDRDRHRESVDFNVP